MKNKELKERVKEIVNRWGQYTSEGGIYWENYYPETSDPEEKMAKEIVDLISKEIDEAREEGREEVYKKFCEWEMPRDLSKEQKEMFDALLSEINKLKQ